MTSLRDYPSSRLRQRPIPRGLLVGVVLIVLGLLWCLIALFQAQDLSDIDDGSKDFSAGVRDLRAVLAQSMAGSYPLRLTEGEINAYLAKTIAMKQQGPLAGWVSLEKVLVRLEKDRAEMILVRRVAGMPLTTSMFLKLEQTESSTGEIVTHVDIDGGAFPGLPFLRQGGRFGRLLLPQGFLLLVRSSYVSYAQQFPEEIRLGFEEMARVRLEEGIIEFDPRFDGGTDLIGF